MKMFLAYHRDPELIRIVWGIDTIQYWGMLLQDKNTTDSETDTNYVSDPNAFTKILSFHH